MYKGNKKETGFARNKEITHYVGHDGLLYTSNGVLDPRVDCGRCSNTLNKEDQRFKVIVSVKLIAIAGMLTYLIIHLSKWH